jgi:4-hydroxybenzoate polyprenyltransferase
MNSGTVSEHSVTTVGFEDAPSWVNWLFAMLGARALGFAYGMFVAARDPRRHVTWIRAMIGIQAIDWIGTLAYLAAGAVTISQVTTAAFLPVIFIVTLGRFAFSPDARAVDVKHSEAQRA